MRPSTLVFNLSQRLLYTRWRDPGEEPKLHLFGQLKRITNKWVDTCRMCKGDTYPALLMYQELADMACNRITAGITRAFIGERPIKALLDPYNWAGRSSRVSAWADPKTGVVGVLFCQQRNPGKVDPLQARFRQSLRAAYAAR